MFNDFEYISEIIVKDNDIQIVDGYKYEREQFKPTLNKLREDYPDNSVLLHRSNCSLCREWALHNFIYFLGEKRQQTKDVDLNYPIPWYEKIAYAIFGTIAWFLI